MCRRVKMFGGVFVLRGIAAAYFAADETESEMYPGVTCLDALLAFVFVGVLEFDLVCVSAVWAESFHGVILSGDSVPSLRGWFVFFALTPHLRTRLLKNLAVSKRR